MTIYFMRGSKKLSKFQRLLLNYAFVSKTHTKIKHLEEKISVKISQKS